MRGVRSSLFALATLCLIGSAVAAPATVPSSVISNVRARTLRDIVTATMTVTMTAPPTPTMGVTATATPTLAPEWGVDALCRCHVPPLDPGSPECLELQRRYVGTLQAAWASQTALARGTDTPTAPPTDVPTPSTTPSATPRPTDEPTPSPAPTWTARVVVVTATSAPSPTTAPRQRLWLPFAFLRRARH